jgi:hypothetical protein
MSPDPDTLMAINASDCMSDALPDNQTLQRKSMRDESATLAAQATAAVLCFNRFMASHPPERMYSIGRDQDLEALAARIEFVPQSDGTVPAGRG